jgi:hypothetical protein
MARLEHARVAAGANRMCGKKKIPESDKLAYEVREEREGGSNNGGMALDN